MVPPWRAVKTVEARLEVYILRPPMSSREEQPTHLSDPFAAFSARADIMRGTSASLIRRQIV
jgi:hypothetical protein